VTSRTHVISTHWFRRTARSAQKGYERIQGAANNSVSTRLRVHDAQRQLIVLGLTATSSLKVKRAVSARRGRWEVVSLG